MKVDGKVINSGACELSVRIDLNYLSLEEVDFWKEKEKEKGPPFYVEIADLQGFFLVDYANFDPYDEFGSATLISSGKVIGKNDES